MAHKMRNFCIIAHIDHGKSTLADRFLEITKTVKKVGMSQVLDSMDLEQERGITIKLAPARMHRKNYELNLIDTPGHVDFQYEVSRSLAAVEGAVLLVDATQGIQAQTLSTLYMAMHHNITIIPVINKIDLPAADVPRVTREIQQVIGIDPSEIIAISAKTGEWVDHVLDAVIERISAPDDFLALYPERYRKDGHIPHGATNTGRALIFDSVFDPYKWVVAFVKVVDGSFRVGQQVALIYSQNIISPIEVGYFAPKYHKDDTLVAGQIGYITTWQKSVRDAKIGDTMLSVSTSKMDMSALQPYIIPGFQKVKPFVFAGVYPMETDDYDKLKSSFEKLALNDSALVIEHETSAAMGHGFRCGFLGMLHMDIIKERLSREYNMETLFTTPTVTYLVQMKNFKDERLAAGNNIKDLIVSGLWKYIVTSTPEDEDLDTDQLVRKYSEQLKPWMYINSGGGMPDHGMLEDIKEPIVEVEVVWPEEYSGNIMQLAQEYRGKLKGMEYLDTQRVLWKYLMPLGEIMIDFYDRLKSTTKWYATMNYEFSTYTSAELVRLDIFINGELVEAFSLVVHEDKAYASGRDIVEKLKDLIPKHMFPIPLQAWVGSKMIARETISAMRKDVIAKCYGGDVSRKKKLLKKQKEGKKKMKQMWRVSIPNDVFLKMVAR